MASLRASAASRDWPRRSLRRHWLQLIRRETVTFSWEPLPLSDRLPQSSKPRRSREQRAHSRLSWSQRLARNARPADAPRLTVLFHGLPAHFFALFDSPGHAIASTSSLQHFTPPPFAADWTPLFHRNPSLHGSRTPFSRNILQTLQFIARWISLRMSWDWCDHPQLILQLAPLVSIISRKVVSLNNTLPVLCVSNHRHDGERDNDNAR